ncbi:MAG TPA: extracellular solute-binding protein [Stellaceae bacterium]
MRRAVTGAALAALVLAAGLGGGTRTAQADAPPLPSKPQVINIIDVGGALALTQKAMEKYRDTHPKLVSRMTFTKAPAPELAGKIKAQQQAGRLDIDLVIGGTDGVSAGMELNEWTEVLPQYADKFSGLEERYLPAARKMNDLAKGQALAVVYYPSGPLLEFMPGAVKDPPKSTAALLDWCKAHPNRFMYARPANSGPGRTFLQALPYLLGDKDPKDPVNGWDKTWAYLKELNSCIEYYPTGTGATMKELGEGSRDMIVSTTGWDINPRAIGVVPKEAQVGKLDGFHWVADAQYLAVPKGIANDKLAVVLDLMAYLLTPEAQAYTYDDGYFYPGPAIKDVPVTMAPAESQQVIKEFGRPEYEQWIADNPIEIPLFGKDLVIAFQKWDQEIGGAKSK